MNALVPIEEAILSREVEELKAHLDGDPARRWQWAMIGDNWLCSWNWARRMQARHGIDEQRAMLYVAVIVMPADAKRGLPPVRYP